MQKTHEKIEIHLNFIGEFELPNAEREPTAEETAADLPMAVNH